MVIRKHVMNKIPKISALVFFGLLIAYTTHYIYKTKYSSEIIKSELDDFELIISDRLDILKSRLYLSVTDMIYQTGKEDKIIFKSLCAKWKPEYEGSIEKYYNDRFKDENTSVRKAFHDQGIIFTEHFKKGVSLLNTQCSQKDYHQD